ncbi:hypothetical protein Q0590_24270 [Rhodocytophaga aerolata]|uniref:Polysaccharide deacetylase family protein n=1 Tax=Rhodocytophaga aerolata TaxID=455078 RepID=A0ABT8RDY7_9BACT|nr:hypothetical protein [Rhodocytophaga aerolata]MDO1449413.1 hypothetical protein [Rhodocytophaga aerolata]
MRKPLLAIAFLLLSSLVKTMGQPAQLPVPSSGSTSVKASPTMDIYLWFDTEDYLLPASDDAALRLADMLTKEGVRATFKVVGEKARTLERRGRQDVIDALKKHEIGYHSNWHSVHPTPAQYLSALGWEEGVTEFVRREEPGAKDVARIFNQQPSCYGQPGSSWGPQSFAAMRRMNIPVYMDFGNHINLFDQPLWYGGVLTIFHLGHTLRMELGGKNELEKAKKDFMAAKAQILAQGGGAVHIYYHPCEWVHQEFWDGVNFNKGENPPREDWKLPPQKSAKETELAFETFHAYLKWMKKQEQIRFVTARDALTIYADQALKHTFTIPEVEALAKAVTDSIHFQVGEGWAVSPAEIFSLLNNRIAAPLNPDKTNQAFILPDTLYGPTEPGPILESPYTTSVNQLQRTAVDVASYLQQHKRIPATIWLGSKGVSPEVYLSTIARLIPLLGNSKPPQTIECKPAKLTTTQYIAQDSEQLWGWLFPTGWHSPALMELAKLQAWTIKPAIRSGK